MATKPIVERRRSDNGNGAGSSPFLSPVAAQASARNSTSSHSNRLSLSPAPPQTASSTASQRPHSRLSRNSRDGSVGAPNRKEHSNSVSSTPHTLASSNRSLSAENRERQRAVRTLPLWVQSVAAAADADDDDDDDNVDATSHLLPRTPASARPASHHYMPTAKSTVPGRKFDHAREGTPVTLSTPVSDSAYRWKAFAQSSNNEHGEIPPSSRGQVVDDAWMRDNMADLEQKWEPIDNSEDQEKVKGFWLFSPAKRKRKLMRFHKTVMNHPMVPAVIRMIVLSFSVVALALSGAIFHESNKASCENNSSTWMAIIVDIVAICYTVYITYDEYTSKPLGLRSHNAKMSLIFLDLAFIVFESANLSLAFQALTDETWACKAAVTTAGACPYIKSICVRQKALTATLLIALLAWLGTFTISTLRLIHRMAR